MCETGQRAGNDLNKRLDRPGIVVGVDQGGAVAPWLEDEHKPGTRHQVNVGTASTAMLLHRPGFRNRHVPLAPPGIANTPIEHLLGKGSRRTSAITRA